MTAMPSTVGNRRSTSIYKGRQANTYVLVSRADSRIILGYLTLSFLEVDLSEVPAKYGKKLPKSHLPAVKLARLAIDKNCQGKNYGRLLLVDAMRRVATATSPSVTPFP
jgi:GNAT superfamily N-acetyltransferase